MARAWFVLLAVVVLLTLSLTPAWAKVVSSTELIEKSKSYDGKTIAYRGEAVGDVMVRGEHAWINVNDGVNAMGIWLPAGQTKIVEIEGDYQHHGDEVEVTGVFNRACAQHGGDMDIHGTEIRLVKKGYPLAHPISSFRIMLAGILSVASGLLFLAGRRKSKRRI